MRYGLLALSLVGFLCGSCGDADRESDLKFEQGGSTLTISANKKLPECIGELTVEAARGGEVLWSLQSKSNLVAVAKGGAPSGLDPKINLCRRHFPLTFGQVPSVTVETVDARPLKDGKLYLVKYDGMLGGIVMPNNGGIFPAD